MKRITSFILVILMLSSTFAYSEGLLPSLTDAYGVDMPSMAAFLEREPDEETTDETGTVTQVFYQVSENDFDGFNKYLEENGCALFDYSVSGNTVTETIEKQGKTFNFSFDNDTFIAASKYPAGTNPEEYKPKLGEVTFSTQQFGEFVFSQNIIEKYKVHREQIEEMYPGQRLIFGKFEQDNDLQNGQEEIEWRIVDVKDGNALILSEYALEYLPYESENETAYWETCSLRRWLNTDFYENAFNDEEKNIFSFLKSIILLILNMELIQERIL